jgi:hypothetical protein
LTEAERIREILGNPIAVLIYLPFLPLLIAAYIFSQAPPSPFTAETRNVEEWTIREDPETGEIKITVHRQVRRG